MLTKEQEYAIMEEFFIATRLVWVGLRELNRMYGSTDFFHLPLLLLSSGFERIMKAILCLYHLKKHKAFPNTVEFYEYHGHDLENLLGKIKERCFSEYYLNHIPVAKMDLDFLNNPILAKIIEVLSNFGKGSRYYYLDVVISKEKIRKSPKEEWETLESEVLRTESINDLKNIGDPFKRINYALTIRFEKLARALTRLLTLSDGGNLPLRSCIPAYHFISLKVTNNCSREVAKNCSSLIAKICSFLLTIYNLADRRLLSVRKVA